jgi:hypothetical protein
MARDLFHDAVRRGLETYQTFFQSRLARAAIERHQIEILVYEPITEEIVQWIN